MTQDTQQNMQQSALGNAVLEKIEHDHIEQVPRYMFTVGESLMWVLWATSVCLGALAFSVIIFFSVQAQYAPYEATHDHLFSFLLEVMPYAWVAVFALMAVLAHYNLRHTKHGYKFAVWQILVSSVVVSFMGGVVLNTAGVGFRVDHLLANRVPLFPAFNALEMRMWQHPEDGRMIGTFVGTTNEPNIVNISDLQGQAWKLDVRELNPKDIETLYNEEKVRIVGLIASTSDHFYGCGVFPWITDKNVTRQELKREREAFIARMREHHDAILDLLLGEEPKEQRELRCATHAAVMRIEEKMER